MILLFVWTKTGMLLQQEVRFLLYDKEIFFETYRIRIFSIWHFFVAGVYVEQNVACYSYNFISLHYHHLLLIATCIVIFIIFYYSITLLFIHYYLFTIIVICLILPILSIDKDIYTVYLHLYLSIDLSTHICYIYIYIYVYIYIYIYTYVYMYYIHTYIYIYIYIYTENSPNLLLINLLLATYPNTKPLHYIQNLHFQHLLLW